MSTRSTATTSAAASAIPASGRRLRLRPKAVMIVVGQVWRHPANRGRRFRQLASTLAFHVRARALKRPTITALGEHSRIWAYPGAISSRVVQGNPPDWPEMLVWRDVLRPGALFVDVGANVGSYTIWALDCGARVIAVEPHTEAIAQLRQNLSLNGYVAEVVQAALADRPGTMRIAGPDLPRQHLVVDSTDDAAGQEVVVLTLDDLLGDRVADGVKIDVEGAERLVLEGGCEALAQGRIRTLQIEWNECSRELLGEDRSATARLLCAHGYRLCRPDDHGRLIPLADPEEGADVFAVLDRP